MVSKSDIPKIMQYRAVGWDDAWIGRKFGVSSTRIFQLVGPNRRRHTHSDDTISRARVLWWQGHSTSEIGRRLGITKNAVVGIAHRNEGFPARPSPIRRAA